MVRKKKIPPPDFYFFQKFPIFIITFFFAADSERNLSVSLIVELKKEGIVTSDKFLEALRELTSSMSDKEPQIPRIHSYVAGEYFIYKN